MRTSSWDDPGAIGSSTITAPASRVWASSAFPCCATTSCRCSTGHAPISPCDCRTGRRRARTTIERSRLSICRVARDSARGGPRRINPPITTGQLPGWATAYQPADLQALLAAYRDVDAEQLWDNLGYFLERVVPAAEQAGVRLAIHPDDPPWPIFGLPRIITNARALERLVALVDSPANGVTFCTGSLGASPENDLPAMVRRLGGRIHFAHCRNVRITGDRQFHETAHPSPCGSVDLFQVLCALRDVGFAGPMRPDRGRMIWGETGRPGYGLYDRALGVTYLQGLWEALSRSDR